MSNYTAYTAPRRGGPDPSARDRPRPLTRRGVEYAQWPRPRVSPGLVIGEGFTAGDPVSLALGDKPYAATASRPRGSPALAWSSAS